MSFSSVSFFVFMIAVFLIYWGIPHKFRYILLICANLIYYGCFGVKCLPILVGEALVVYVFSHLLNNSENKSSNRSKVIFIFAIILTVSPLLVFKYLNFSIYIIDKLLSKITVPVSDHTLSLLEPIGISFYTFESLSYIIDVYKGKIKAEKNFLKLFSFLSFFPSITSGPIERAGSFLPQLEKEKKFNYEQSVYGMRLVLLGMIKKLCGADVLKQYVDAVFGNIYAYKGPAFIVAIILYTYEIYLDFSGYTDMARGFALMLGFDLSENFKAPYLSVGIKEFFGRWHISLSTWLRDYIYIPLGGGRCKRSRKCVNLMLTFLVSGIWHGASVTFIVWGILHGIYQCVAECLKDYFSKLGKVSRIIITFGLVSFAWMFFRANSIEDAKYVLKNMIIGDNFYGQMLQMGFLSVAAYVGVVVIILFTILHDIASERIDIIKSVDNLKAPVRWVIYIAAGVIVVVLRSHIGAGNDFIYFQF